MPAEFTLTVGPAADTSSVRESIDDMLGVTIKYGPSGREVGPDGDWVLLTGDDALDQRLGNRLRTRRGAWAFRPNWGASLEDMVNAPIEAGTDAEIVRNATEQCEADKGVSRVLEVSVEQLDDEETVRVRVEFEKVTGDRGDAEFTARRR